MISLFDSPILDPLFHYVLPGVMILLALIISYISRVKLNRVNPNRKRYMVMLTVGILSSAPLLLGFILWNGVLAYMGLITIGVTLPLLYCVYVIGMKRV